MWCGMCNGWPSQVKVKPQISRSGLAEAGGPVTALVSLENNGHLTLATGTVGGQSLEFRQEVEARIREGKMVNLQQRERMAW